MGSCFIIFSFQCSILLKTIVCVYVLFFLRIKATHYHLGIFKLFLRYEADIDVSVFSFISSSMWYIVLFVFLLPVSLDCPFLLVPSVFSNVYLLTIYLLCLVDVFCNRQSTFLWVSNNWCPLLLDWFLVLYRGDFMLGLTNQNELKLARSCNFTSRYL
jgi:hypothetical protein